MTTPAPADAIHASAGAAVYIVFVPAYLPLSTLFSTHSSDDHFDHIMPSRALRHWQTRSRKVLDEFEATHALITGTPSARRFARQQIAQAYVVLLCSQFQRFCRDLYTESANVLANHPAFQPLAPVLSTALSVGRRLNTGNANPSNLGADFGRFGIDFWSEVNAAEARNAQRQKQIEELHRWRNAIAHQDFSHTALEGRETIQIAEVRRWRRACASLAVEFDRVLALYLLSITGSRPW